MSEETASEEGTTEETGTEESGVTQSPAQDSPEQATGETESEGETLLTPATDPGESTEANEETSPYGAPEEYAEWTMADGYQLHPDFAGTFGELAREGNLTQDFAQRFLDLSVQAQAQAAADETAAWNAKQESWISELRADNEIGGDHFDDSIALANASLARLEAVAPGVSNALIGPEGGIGNHPAVIKALVHIERAMADDTVHGNTDQSGSTDSSTPIAHQQYPGFEPGGAYERGEMAKAG